MKPSMKLAIWIMIFAALALMIIPGLTRSSKPSEITYSEFLAMVNNGKVAEVMIQESDIFGLTTEKEAFHTYAPRDPELINILRNKNVAMTAKPNDTSVLNVIFMLLPILLIVFWLFFMNRMQGGAGKAMSFGQSKAKLDTNSEKVKFDDVAGIDEAKEEVREIVDFLSDPGKFTRLGGRIPKGTLLIGSPGTGKTLLARAIAGEAGVPFFSISGSDFVEMFVGVGASRVRDLFARGKKHAPCVIFIDEIDAVGRHRGAGLGGGHDEREQTLNQLLVEMDGFAANEGVIVIAASNRPDILDPALLRPGRFDRQVVVPVPDIKGREQIFLVHFRGKVVAKDVDASVLARGTPGFTGADIENLVNEAALLATKRGKDAIAMAELEDAKDKVMMGTERKSMIISPAEKKITAYHEAGHVLVAKLLPGTDPIHKVTIIPRGRALGLTQQLPIDEKHNYSEGYLLNTIKILLGGRAAEELVLRERTTGASNDIERATELARKMVCVFGMSELGALFFGKKEEQIFLGREIAQHRDYSEETARKIDAAVKKLVDDASDQAFKLLRIYIHELHKIAEALLEKETLNGIEIDAILSKKAV